MQRPSLLLRDGAVSSHLGMLAAAVSLALSGAQSARGGSATWKANPGSGDWNTAANWTPASVPDGPADVATFGQSDTTGLTLSADTEVASLAFFPGASLFTIMPASGVHLSISGDGIQNDSGLGQNFVAVSDGKFAQFIEFRGSATAGSVTTFTNIGGRALFGFDAGGTFFYDSSTAGDASISNQAATRQSDQSGETSFFGQSTAGQATLVNAGATTSAFGGDSAFDDESNAGNASIINQAGTGGSRANLNSGFTSFAGTSSAGNATINHETAPDPGSSGGTTAFIESATAGNATFVIDGSPGEGEGGKVTFYQATTGGTARVIASGNGVFDLSLLGFDTPDFSIGSLEGSGEFRLGGENFTVGTNNLSTTVTGVLNDTPTFGGASLTKAGVGTLTLSGANTYSRGTVISAGTLIANNSSGSATGLGAVAIASGTFGGGGTVAGAVTVGAASGPAANLEPSAGSARPVTLTIQSALTWKASGIYVAKLNAKRKAADQVAANGVTITTGARLRLRAMGAQALPLGTTFLLISNTSSAPINGVFANLPEGAILVAAGNNFRASYTGGDGNDLTLTVSL